MQTFIMLAYICIIMGIPMCAVLHPEYIMSPGELELFSILSSNPELFHFEDFDKDLILTPKLSQDRNPIFEDYLRARKESIDQERKIKIFDELANDDPIKIILFKELLENPENYKNYKKP
jgi:hypothetical protein